MSETKKQERELSDVRRLVAALRMRDAQLEAAELGCSPDVWIRRANQEDIAVEHTRYDSGAGASSPSPHVAVQARWEKHIWPRLDRERKKANLVNTRASLSFRERSLPKREYDELAAELVSLIKDQSGKLGSNQELELYLFPRDVAEQIHLEAVASEDWPVCARHLSHVRVEHLDWQRWPIWDCPGALSGFCEPSSSALRKAFNDKFRQTCSWNEDSFDLWILIVCNDSEDITSHIFPTSIDDLDRLHDTIGQSGFDLARAHFDRVWLLARDSGHALRVHPWSREIYPMGPASTPE